MQKPDLSELSEALTRSSLVLFIGADLDEALTGLPSRADLARVLSHRKGLEESSLSLAEVAQRVSRAGNRWEFTNFIRHELDTTGKLPKPFHQRIIKLLQADQIRTIITTAYDNLLELSLVKAGITCNKVVTDSNVPFMNPDLLTLIKLYGDIQQPETLVVTDGDHSALLRDRNKEALLDEVRVSLRRNTVLFIGYDLTDPDFRFLFDQIAESRFARTAYAVWPGLPETDIQMWRDRGIIILDREPLEILDELGTSFTTPLYLEIVSSKSALPSPMDDEISDDKPLYGTGNRWAVLVGVNRYDDRANYGRLHVCVNDVDAIYNQLIASGFCPDRIQVLTDKTPKKPTKLDILSTLQSVANATDQDDLFLFYYSGHGDEDGSESYLVSRSGRRIILSDSAVPVSRVEQIMRSANARAKVILLDACHSGANIDQKGPKPMSQEFINRVFEQAEGLAILASCKQDELSYEWKAKERSVFTHYLLEALKGEADRDSKGFVSVQDASRHILYGVRLWASQTNRIQTPTLKYDVVGDIILAKLRESPLPPLSQ